MSDTNKEMMSYADMVKALRKDGKEIVSQLDGGQADIVHMTFGVVTEVRELVQAIFANDMVNAKEEVGDYIFYLTGLRQAVKEYYEEWPDSPAALPSVGYDITGFIMQTLNLADYVKKMYAYNKDLDVKNVAAICDELAAMLTSICASHQINIDDAMDANQVKLLKGRYKDGKFTDKDASARADKTEDVPQKKVAVPKRK